MAGKKKSDKLIHVWPCVRRCHVCADLEMSDQVEATTARLKVAVAPRLRLSRHTGNLLHLATDQYSVKSFHCSVSVHSTPFHPLRIFTSLKPAQTAA